MHLISSYTLDTRPFRRTGAAGENCFHRKRRDGSGGTNKNSLLFSTSVSRKIKRRKERERKNLKPYFVLVSPSPFPSDFSPIRGPFTSSQSIRSNAFSSLRRKRRSWEWDWNLLELHLCNLGLLCPSAPDQQAMDEANCAMEDGSPRRGAAASSRASSWRPHLQAFVSYASRPPPPSATAHRSSSLRVITKRPVCILLS